MYARYTEIEFDVQDRERVLEVWERIGLPSAVRQQGFRGSYILESEDTPGTLRLLTLWDAPEDFERYYTGEEHVGLSAAIKAAGMRGVKRDGMRARFHATRPGGLVRITRAAFEPSQVDAAAEFWRETGASLMRSAPGCLRADAYRGTTPGEFILLAEWSSQDDADRFLTGPDHKAFGARMDALTSTVTDRIVGERIA